MARAKTDASGKIAIVGLGSRFPQAKDTPAFWDNILKGKSAFQPIPRDRWKHEYFYDDNPRAIDKIWTTGGSFLEDIKSFPALHFGISPRRLEVMDPQHRLLIEATRWALQDAGFEGKEYDRRRMGVFIGLSVSEFKSLSQAQLNAVRLASGDFGTTPAKKEVQDALMDLSSQVPPIRAFSLSGSLTALGAAGISQTFDLGGPAYTIDAACASALVAVNDAVIQLRAGVIDHALAGGVYINLSPDNLVCFSRIGAISPKGVCRPFDAQADGFVQSDGVGVVVLKRLEDAQAEGDRIYAVICGTACNNDGRGDSPMAPLKSGQRDVLQSAYLDAGVSPSSIAYFEAHGTATSVGDPVEVEALGTLLLEEGVSLNTPTALGSVKGNIGHAMSAAGIAGLLKGIKVLEHKTAPPMAGFSAPHPSLQMERWPLRVSNQAEPLVPKGGEPLRVAISSFGFGGTNAHMILEEAPLKARSARVSLSMTEAQLGPMAPPETLLVSACSPELLASHLDELTHQIKEGALGKVSLPDLAYTLNTRRSLERVRTVIEAPSVSKLLSNFAKVSAALKQTMTFPRRISSSATVFDAGDAVDAKPQAIPVGVGSDIAGMCTRAALGHPVDFEALYQGEGRKVVTLPETPLKRQSYWIFNDNVQPAPILDVPLPPQEDAKKPVLKAAKPQEADSSLDELLRGQARLLQKHEEIMAHHGILLDAHKES